MLIKDYFMSPMTFEKHRSRDVQNQSLGETWCVTSTDLEDAMRGAGRAQTAHTQLLGPSAGLALGLAFELCMRFPRSKLSQSPK